METETSLAPQADDADDATGRDLVPWQRLVAMAIGVPYALYFLHSAIFGVTAPREHRGVYLLGGAVLILLVWRPATHPDSRRIVWMRVARDWVLATAAVASFGYFILNYEAMIERVGALSQLDIAMGFLAMVLSLELTRRTGGWILTSIGLAAVAYTFLGPHLPSILEHRGHSLDRLVSTVYSVRGVFGIVADVMATYVFVFIVFGTFFAKTGATQFFVDFPYAMAGRLRGGPAKVAIIVSGLMGSINGSAVANVMTTGPLTIPLMKRSGYRGEFSAGVEAAASTGGGILPPIMGASAFLVAQFTGQPYARIIAVATLPALMYFAAMFFLVDFQAIKRGLVGLPKEELESPWTVLKRGWYFLIPIAVIVYMILGNYSVPLAAVGGILSTIAVGQVPYRGRRLTLKDTFDALWQSSLASLVVAGIAGTIGIILATMGLTGLGLRFSSLVVAAAGGSLILTLIYVTIASWVLGAGLTVTSSYVIVSILAVPALTEFGITPLVAHLIILWVSQDANVTPPVSVAAYAAGAIARVEPMKAGWEAWKLARGMYVVPFMMAYTGLVEGTWDEVLEAAVTGFVGIYLLAAMLAGYWIKRLTLPERVGLLGASVLLIVPGLWAHLGGVALAAVVLYFQKRKGSMPPDVGPESAVGESVPSRTEELDSFVRGPERGRPLAQGPTRREGTE